MTEEKDFLARVPLFAGLKTEELEGLANHIQTLSFQKGDEIIREGERDRRLFIIVRGTVEVIKARGQRNERRLATLGPSDYFGEMALIDDLFRSATVVAKEATEVLSLDQWDVRDEVQKHPSLAFELLKTLSQRVRALETVIMHSLGGLLPICLSCKNVRDENGTWVRIEDYIADRSEADFTHGICPDCMKRLYPKHFARP